LPIGGVKDKVLAARRAGLTTVILPKQNEGDLDDLPKEARKSMHFVLAAHIDEVLRAALEQPVPEVPATPETIDALTVPPVAARQQEIAVVA
jgi:ATP-dependent Lon protease